MHAHSNKVACSPLGWIPGCFPWLVSALFNHGQVLLTRSTRRAPTETHTFLPKRENNGLFLPGTLNIHPSLLPLYRGASPVQRALEVSSPFLGHSQGAFRCGMCGPFGLRPATRKSGAQGDWLSALLERRRSSCDSDRRSHHFDPRFTDGSTAKRAICPTYRAFYENHLSIWLWNGQPRGNIRPDNSEHCRALIEANGI